MKAIQKDKAGWEIVGPAGGWVEEQNKNWRKRKKIREEDEERKRERGKKDSVTIKGLT